MTIVVEPTIIDMEREPSLGEVADDVREIRDLIKEMRSTTIRSDVYQAHQEALRSEMRLEFTTMRTELAAVDGKAAMAQKIALWVLGIFAVAVLSAIVGILSRII